MSKIEGVLAPVNGDETAACTGDASSSGDDIAMRPRRRLPPGLGGVGAAAPPPSRTSSAPRSPASCVGE